jgi:hypothetical protein
MEKLLSAYLFEYKNCPLPSVGSLLLQPGHAKYLPGENKMLAPVPFVELAAHEAATDNLLRFIAFKKNISIGEADIKLGAFCKRLTSMQAYEELPFDTAGSFYMDENGKLHFKTLSVPTAFLPAVAAERVIHPDVAHSMLVGDKETNSTAMSELLNDETVSRSRWWIAAIILAVLALIIVFIYYYQNEAGATGNAMPVKPAPAPKTYTTTE